MVGKSSAFLRSLCFDVIYEGSGAVNYMTLTKQLCLYKTNVKIWHNKQDDTQVYVKGQTGVKTGRNTHDDTLRGLYMCTSPTREHFHE